jgi:hypothetical protein
MLDALERQIVDELPRSLDALLTRTEATAKELFVEAELDPNLDPARKKKLLERSGLLLALHALIIKIVTEDRDGTRLN